MRYLIGLLALCCAVMAETRTAVALRDARVVTVGGPTLERGTVLLRDGIIEAVGEGVAIPPDAWVIEARGLTVYPGLMDALTLLEQPPSGAARPVGPAPDAPSQSPPRPARGPQDRPSANSWLRAADLLNASDRRLAEARNAGFTNAVIYPAAGIFAGQGAVLSLAGEKRRMIVASPAGQFLTLIGDRGYTGFPVSLMGALAYIKQVYIDAAHYQAHRLAYERRRPGVSRPDYDRALEGVLESPRALLPARSKVELERMARFAADLKTPAVLYGGDAGYDAADALAKARLPVLVSLKWPERPRDADPDYRESLRLLELRERAPSTPAVLAKAGVPFAFYTDGTAPRDVAKAVKRAIDAGLPETDALRALTLAPARIYGLADRMGSIEKGKLANLVVTDGPLFAETTKVKYIFVEGLKFEPPPDAPPSAPAAPPTGGDL
ncbi:MAG TPA: amidohydrolase family protein [Bryobacteraceae bacterium]|nr:amidohydrolase family protein [Bryobacteraceae bacterium]